MRPFDAVMWYYPYVFHPTVVLGVGALLVIHWEWGHGASSEGPTPNRALLLRRVLTFLGAGLLSLVPVGLFMLVTGQGPMETMRGNAAHVDALVAAGTLLAAGTTWLAWRRFDWGSITPALMVTYAVVVLPYAAASPFWNVSGHVLLATTPALFLALLDRRYLPLLAVAVVMVPNRVLLGAHTPDQAVGGFFLGVLVVGGLWYRRRRLSPAYPVPGPRRPPVR